MSDFNINDQLFDLIKPLSVEKRIDVLFTLFENPDLFKVEDVSILTGFLQLATKENLSTKIDNFLSLLYNLDNLEKPELEKIIDDNITLKPDDVDLIKYIERIRFSLDNFYTTTFDVLKEKLLQEKTNKTEKPVITTTEKTIPQAELVSLFGFDTSNMNNLRKLGHFKNSIQLPNKRFIITWDDVDEYVKIVRTHRKIWEEYKSKNL